MADVTYIYENLLPERTPVAVNDFIRVIGSDNASYKALVSNLAKCIVENYAGSSLAGADKSIQNAINEINTKVDLADGGLAIAASASAMINHDLIYVYTGNETGYTYGDWYFWNGSAWTSGGEVGSIVPDASLSQEGRAADAKATGDLLSSKADKDGVIATAEGLIGGAYITEKEPYHFRKTAVDLAGRLDETVVGGSLGWNQLVQNGNFESASGWTASFSSLSVSNNEATLVSDKTNLVGSEMYRTDMNFSANRVCVVSCMVKTSNTPYFRVRYPVQSQNVSLSNDGQYHPYAIIVKTGTSGLTGFGLRAIKNNASDESTVSYKGIKAIDLTACFGTTIADYIYSLEQSSAGAGVAWVKRYIDLDKPHPYDAGSIQSVEGLVSHDVVGFNQWNEEWENGYYSSTTGEKASSNNCIRCKNKIPVIPGATYFHNLTNSYLRRQNWDADGNFISQQSVVAYREFTIPDNAHYITFFCDDTYGKVYNHDICINLSDPSRNGTYEPYEKHSYPLDPTVKLNGVFKLVGDHLEADGDRWYSNKGIERRYVVVDLGTFNWSLAEDHVFYNTVMENKVRKNQGVFCSKYANPYTVNTKLSNMTDKTVQNRSDTNVLYIKDSDYSDAATFKTAMSGVYLVYELATPTTETAQPFQSPMIVGATEEYVTDSVVPVGHESKYYEDVAKKVSGLPKDFSTLIAPTEVTFTATRNYSVGNYLIVKNQLYKVTSAISSGGTITPNSNVTATTIMAEILALA